MVCSLLPSRFRLSPVLANIPLTVFQTLDDVWRAATSKTARRSAVLAVLLALASAVLYGLAVAAYVAFYRDYIPHLVRTVPVYLQYGSSTPAAAGQPHHHRLAADAALHAPVLPHHPYGLADLRGLGLKTEQDYDVAVSLTVPRSPANRAAGNFMLELALASGGGGSGGGGGDPSAALTAATRLPPPHADDARAFLAAGGRRVVFAAARPALLPYTDPLVAQAARLLFLPYHLLAPAAAERDRLVVPMAEALVFDAGSGGGGGPGSAAAAALPTVLFLELRSASVAAGLPEPVQTYTAEVVFSARLRGLRWFMYQYRLVAFVVLTTAFWLVEVAGMVIIYFLLGLVWDDAGSGGGGGGAGSPTRGDDDRGRLLAQPRIKAEEDTDDEGPTPRAIKQEDGVGDDNVPFAGKAGKAGGGELAEQLLAYDDNYDDDDGDDEDEEENEEGSGEAPADDKQLRDQPSLRRRVTAVHGPAV